MRYFSILLVSVLFFVVTPVMAETYKVQKGDTLSAIALKYPEVTWKEILEANKNLKDPKMLSPGMEIVIPPPPKVRYWRTAGGEPFTVNRSKVRGVRMFSLPEKVKELAIGKLQTKEWEYFTIRNGDKFEEMMFGNYKIWSNVIVAWAKDDKTGYGRRVSVEFEGKMYYIAFPFVCHNISWWSEKIEKEEPPPPPTPTPPCPEEGFWQPDFDSYVWASRFNATSGDAYSENYGGKFILWLTKSQHSIGTLESGLGGTFNGWTGESDSGFNFHGKRYHFGPVLKLIQDNGTETSLAVQLGKQKDVGKSPDGLYDSLQRTDILHVGISHDTYPKTKHIDKIQAWFNTNFDLDHNKSSSYDGWGIDPANDPAEDKTAVEVGARFHTWKSKYLKGGVGFKADHAFGSEATGVNVGPFVADNGEYFIGELEFRNVSGAKYDDANGNSWGVGASLDLGKSLKTLYKKARSD